MSLSENIKKLMHKRNISQSELARQLGISRQHVNNYIKGRNVPPLDMQEKLCVIFGVDMNTLVGGYMSPVKSTLSVNANGKIQDDEVERLKRELEALKKLTKTQEELLEFYRRSLKK